LDFYSYPIFIIISEMISVRDTRGLTDHQRRGPIDRTYGPSGDANIRAIGNFVAEGIISGYGYRYMFSEEKTSLTKCQFYKDAPEDEATLYGGSSAKLCENSMTTYVLGNGICNGRLNVPAYGFDFGDCCLPELRCVSPYHALNFDFSHFW
jgi:hypothetical protein